MEEELRFWARLAVGLAAQGAHERALSAYEEALDLASRSGAPAALASALWDGRGATLRALSRLNEAAEAYGRAIALDRSAGSLNNLGLVEQERGRPEVALSAFEEALAIAPEEPGARAAIHNNRANALRELGEHGRAEAAFGEAIALDPGRAAPRYNLHASLLALGREEEAVAALRAALKRAPEHAHARFHLALLLEREGRPDEADHLLLDLEGRPEAAHLLSSFAHLRAAGIGAPGGPRLFACARQVLRFALESAEAAGVAGLVLELGVRFGSSLRFLAAHAGQEVHGFDSFEGLPEAWGERAAGLYSTGGALPEVPDTAHLHVGLFRDTLPPFLAEVDGWIKLINVDCDLYRSTKTALDLLADRLRPGSILVFDEYLANPGWEREEHLAFEELQAARGLRSRALAYSPFTRQAVMEILP